MVKQSMSPLSLIRLFTYGIFLVLAITAHKQRYFVSFYTSLPDANHPFLRRDPDERRHGGDSPSALPGFADTRLPGRKILQLAESKAKNAGVDLRDYGPPDIMLNDARGSLKWSVTWFGQGKRLRIWIDDETEASEVDPRRQ